MKHVTIGTAGHVDHGKTELVRRLTGVDTDRLPEEKERGMTIDLGFAPLILPSGRRVSIVDVPGHERFVRTMVAGVTGIDFVVLVVAADEGVMPQTREHLEILNLLGITKGVIALTKADLAESEEWLGMVQEEVREAVSGSPLNSARIIPVSSVTGRGIPELVAEMERLAEKVSSESAVEFFRLPIDRAFTLPGHGLIVTGTMTGGTIRAGMEIEILPSAKRARVRTVQVHREPADEACEGDRAALNLVGLEKDDVGRGDVVVLPGSILPSRLVDVSLNATPSGEGIVHGQRVRFLAGTSEVMARVRLIGTEEIAPGEKGYGQLRLEGPAVLIPGDPFIVRDFSPVVTIGGGRILSINPRHRKPSDTESYRRLSVLDSGSTVDKLDLHIAERFEGSSRGQAKPPMFVDELVRAVFLPMQAAREALVHLEEAGRITWIGKGEKFLPSKLYAELAEALMELMKERNRKDAFQIGVEREEARSLLAPAWGSRDFAALLGSLADEGRIVIQGSRALPADWSRMVEAIESRQDVKRVEEAYANAGLAPTRIEELAETSGITATEAARIASFLLSRGNLINLNSGVIMHKDVIWEVRERLIERFGSDEWFATAEIRDYLKCSRKIAVALLEYFDTIGWTDKKGDVRHILPL